MSNNIFSNKRLFLPVESKVRELDSKILLALCMAKKGFSVVVGEQRTVFDIAKCILNGVVLAKSAASFEIEKIEKIKSKGHKYCVLDEEGLVHSKERVTRYTQQTVDAVDKIFVHGNHEKNNIESSFNIKENLILVTGNLRFDFYKLPLVDVFSQGSEQIKSKYGRYIFIPSRFGGSNHFMKKEMSMVEYLKKLQYIKNDKERMIFEEFMVHSDKLFNSFLELIPILSSNFPQYQIIIRPHPSELIEAWEKCAEGLDNVHVKLEGSVAPWILGAEVVIHNGCTTGLEAYLMGKNVLSYMPFISETGDLELPNEVSKKTFTLDELLENTANILHSKFTMPDKTEYVKNYLHNVGSIHAYESLSETLAKIGQEVEGSVEEFKFPVRIKLKNILQKIKAKYSKDSKYKYSSQKFPLTDLVEIEQHAKLISDTLELDMNNIVITQHADNLFHFALNK